MTRAIHPERSGVSRRVEPNHPERSGVSREVEGHPKPLDFRLAFARPTPVPSAVEGLGVNGDRPFNLPRFNR